MEMKRLSGGNLRAAGYDDRNRLLVVASGDARAVERAFDVSVHRVLFHGARKYAVLSKPTLPADIASFTSGVSGLDDLAELHPAAAVGSACCHFSPSDTRTFYDDQLGLDGSGQTIAIVTAKAVKDTDVQGFDAQWGLPPLPQGSGQVCVQNGTSCTSSAGVETTLDVEEAHGIAPGAVIKWYAVSSPSASNFTVAINRVVSDNPGHQVSMSWDLCEALQPDSVMATDDSIFANGAAIGQTWFIASGDRGSTGDCPKNGPTVEFPASSPHVVAVGGTTAVCSSGMTPQNPDCGGYGSESGWSGSGGGASAVFAKPSWQTGCGVPNDGARDVPDVALLGSSDPGYWVLLTGKWLFGGGTSFGAPEWAGFFAQLNQKRGGNGLGLANPRLYQLCGKSAFHDITSGNNGLFNAGPGYDQVTGVGTVDAANLFKAY